MLKYSLIILILYILICSLSLELSANSSVLVSTHDLTFKITGNGSFNVSLMKPATVNLTIWFNYTDGSNLIPLPDDFVIECGTKQVLHYDVRAKTAGHSTVLVKTTPPIVNTEKAFVRVDVYKVHEWVIASTVIGWLYFICWLLSFYPQIIENYRRKSVVGLNFDFLGLNFTGFIAYAVFNIGLRYIHEVQLEYNSIHPTGVIPVEVNDVAYAVLALFASSTTVIQSFIYEHGDQFISKITVAVLALIWSSAIILLLLTTLGVNKHTPWLTFLYFFSYVKLGVTLTKYIPQVIFNYKRKSTVGWSIGSVLLDIVGGLFSIGQMFIIAYNFNDWYSIIGNFSKFGLGLISVAFDVIFIVQHYYLYGNKLSVDSSECSLLQ